MTDRTGRTGHAGSPDVWRRSVCRLPTGRPLAAFLACLLVPILMLSPLRVDAQTVPSAEGPAIPLFIDPSRIFEKPTDVPASITFLTTLDFPPFNFVTQDGKLTGFHVDLAREICDLLRARCQMRVVAFNRLVRNLVDGKGQAAIAGMAETPRTRRRLRFTVPYLRMAGRFVGPTGRTGPAQPSGQRVSVVVNSAHAAFLARYFPTARAVSFDTVEQAREAIRTGNVNLHFGDALTLSFWLQSDAAEGCCAFRGGAYFDETYFGRGLAIAVPGEATALRSTLNYALQRLVANGKFAELYLRYFPVSVY
ncbi:MAG: transporter substrate-binding domain-containing protein [Pseudomonadota bacterium]